MSDRQVAIAVPRRHSRHPNKSPKMLKTTHFELDVIGFAAMKPLPLCQFHPLRCLVLGQGQCNEAALKSGRQGS
jgi:hypothetical protein